ncbi:MAG: flagellar biogenesis protein FliO [Bacteriovoracaceae bacterium]|jgi:flagellar biogenesis protein FliO
MKKLVLLITFTLLVGSNAFAKSKVRSIEYKSDRNQQGTLVIDLKGPLSETPELLVKDNMIQVSVPDSFVWPKIEKKISVKKDFDATVLAYQFNKGTVRVRTMLPFSLKGKEAGVNVTLKDRQIVVNFPRGKVVQKVSKSKPSKSVSAYDETYLEELLKNKKTMEKEYGSELAPAGTTANKGKAPVKEDQVNMALSAQDKKAELAPKSSFSVMSYIGKFVAFLGVVLLLFYGVVALMRKGVMKKGKLGFLNNQKMVEVLSTTYVAPKKSVMMVRAHNQVFLVGSSDAGLQPLGEINDVNGLLKDGEKKVAGNNFDTSLFDADNGNKEFKLKDMSEAKTEETTDGNPSLAALLAENTIEEKVKLSDQIKNKVKNLKSFQ